MAFRARAFNCGHKQSIASSWCESCDWKIGQCAHGEVLVVSSKAKKHTEQTGHVTRIDISQQRGYELHPYQGGRE